MALSAGSAFVNILPNFSGFGRKMTRGVQPGMQEATGAVDQFIGRVEQIPDSFGVAGKAVDAFTGGALRNISSLGHTMTTKVALAAETAFAGTGVKLYANVERGLREVNTLFGMTGAAAEQSFGMISEDVRGLSNELGIAQTTLVSGLYQSLSAGVPRENAAEFLRVATKAAIGGVTDTETAVDGLSTAINAFGLDVTDAEMVADSFFTAVVGGKTTMGELAAAFSNVAPVAAAAGISIQETNAAISTLTAAGVPTAEATTQIRAAIQGLVRPSAKLDQIFQAVGHTNAEAALEAEGLGFALQTVQDATGGSTGALQQLLGSIEAVNAAQIIAGTGAAKFAQEVDAQANSAGAAQGAFEEMEKSQARAWERLRTSVENFSIVIGEALGPAIRLATGLVEGITDLLTAMPKPLQQGIGLFVGLATALGPPVYMVARLVIAYRALRAIQAGVVAGSAARSLTAAGNAAKMASRHTISYNLALGTFKAVDFTRQARQMGMVAVATRGAALAFRGLMAAVNPWSIAIVGAISIYTAYSSAKAEAKARTDEFVEALGLEGAAVEETINSIISKRIAEEDLLPIAERLGISTETLIRAMRGEENARRAVDAVMDSQTTHAELQEAGYFKLRKAVLGTSGEMEEAKKIAETKAKVDKVASGVQGEFTDSTVELAASQEELAKALQKSLDLSDIWGDALSDINTKISKSARDSAELVRRAAGERLTAVRDGLRKERDALDARHRAELDLLIGEEATEIVRRRHEEEIRSLDARTEAELKAADATAKAEEERADAIEKAAERTSLTPAEVKKAAEKRLAETKKWFGNLAVVSARGGGAIIEELMGLGPEAADMIGELSTLSEPEFDEFVATIEAGSKDAVERMTEELEKLPAALDVIGSRSGEALAKSLVDQFIAGTLDLSYILAAGAPGVERATTGQVLTGPLLRRQHGGQFRAGDRLLVGEAGPEIAQFGQSGTIIPGTGEGVTIENLNVTTVADASPDELAGALSTTLAWRLASRGWN